MVPARFLFQSAKARRRLKQRLFILGTIFLFGACFAYYSIQSKASEANPIANLVSHLRRFEDGRCNPKFVFSDPLFREQVQHLTPRDVAEAVITASRYTGAIVDVGANKGWPVTRMALKIGGRNVYSVEPDDRNFNDLSSRNFSPDAKEGDFKFKPILGAAGKEAGMIKMMFHQDRDDFTCVNCLSDKSDKVDAKEVKLYAMQDVVDEKEVCLFKTDTQGFELSVLQGSEKLFDENKVRYLLVEFDPKLLQRRENAINLLNYLENQGFTCAHLKCVSFEKGMLPSPFGLKIERQSFNSFVDHLEKDKSYTDLFCSRTPSCFPVIRK